MTKVEKNERYYYAKYQKIFGGIVRFALPAYFFGEEIPEEPSYIVSNHLTIFDPALTFAYTKGYKRFVSKIELKKAFIIGKIFDRMGAVFLNRQAEGGDLSSVKKILKGARSGDTIAIFPEGTRNKKSLDMLPIKDGISLFVLKSNPLVVPLMIYNRQRFFKRNYVYVGKPLDLSEYKTQKIDGEVLDKVKQLIQEHMEATKAKLDDYMASGGAKKLKKLYKQQKKENKKKVFVIKTDEI